MESRQGFLLNKTNNPTSAVLWQDRRQLGIDVFNALEDTDIILKKSLSATWDYSKGRVEFDSRKTKDSHILLGEPERYPESYRSLPDLIHLKGNETYKLPDKLGYDLILLKDFRTIEPEIKKLGVSIPLKDYSAGVRFDANNPRRDMEIVQFSLNALTTYYRSTAFRL